MDPYHPDPEFYTEGTFSETGKMFRARHRLPDLPKPDQEATNAQQD